MIKLNTKFYASSQNKLLAFDGTWWNKSQYKQSNYYYFIKSRDIMRFEDCLSPEKDKKKTAFSNSSLRIAWLYTTSFAILLLYFSPVKVEYFLRCSLALTETVIVLLHRHPALLFGGQELQRRTLEYKHHRTHALLQQETVAYIDNKTMITSNIWEFKKTLCNNLCITLWPMLSFQMQVSALLPPHQWPMAPQLSRPAWWGNSTLLPADPSTATQSRGGPGSWH